MHVWACFPLLPFANDRSDMRNFYSANYYLCKAIELISRLTGEWTGRRLTVGLTMHTHYFPLICRSIIPRKSADSASDYVVSAADYSIDSNSDTNPSRSGG